MAVFKSVHLYFTKLLKVFMTIVMFAVVFVMIQLQQNWLFASKFNSSETHEQKEFEFWLRFEVLLVYSYILGTAAYVFAYRLKKTNFIMKCHMKDDKCFGDFLDAHMINLDLTNAIICPAILGIMLWATETELMTKGSNALAILIFLLCDIQSICILISILADGADVNRRLTYNRKCPSVIKSVIYISLIGIPITIVTICTIKLLVADENTFFPLFMIFVQCFLGIFYFFYCKEKFDKHIEEKQTDASYCIKIIEAKEELEREQRLS